jgi:tRNA(fMet)-specific endonuclease VapC
VTVLFDTNACIAVINGRPAVVRDRVRLARSRGETLMVSSISLFELWYGIAKSANAGTNAGRLADFLAPLVLLLFDEDDARSAGHIRAALERQGRPIGAYDLLIAGQAARRGLLLVSADVGEFSRVEGLRVENWAA